MTVWCSATKANRINAYFRVPLYSQQQGAWVEACTPLLLKRQEQEYPGFKTTS
jgi:hypothetical protein